MQKYFEILKSCPLFSGTSDAELTALLHCLLVKVVSFGKGDTIIFDGSPAKYIGIVLEGRVQMISIDYYGNRNIITEASPGEMFVEEFAASDSHVVPLSVVAVENCTVMLVECSRVIRSCSHSCQHHHTMIFNLMKALAKKNITFHERMEITSKRTTREKLMAYLINEAKKGGSAEFDIPFDRQELADYLEVDRSGLSTEIGKLVRDGVIRTHRSHFRLL